MRINIWLKKRSNKNSHYLLWTNWTRYIQITELQIEKVLCNLQFAIHRRCIHGELVISLQLIISQINVEGTFIQPCLFIHLLAKFYFKEWSLFAAFKSLQKWESKGNFIKRNLEFEGRSNFSYFYATMVRPAHHFMFFNKLYKNQILSKFEDGSSGFTVLN